MHASGRRRRRRRTGRVTCASFGVLCATRRDAASATLTAATKRCTGERRLTCAAKLTDVAAPSPSARRLSSDATVAAARRRRSKAHRQLPKLPELDGGGGLLTAFSKSRRAVFE